MGKVIGRFDPTPSRTPEECERHYTQVHVRMAQELLRPMPSLLSYYTDRAVAQADVDETVVLDRVDGQLALAKFMIEADRAPGVDADASWKVFSALADRVRDVMDGAFGARRVIVSRVLNEVECEPLDVEGQRPIGLLQDTTRLGYIEAYFDYPRWGEEALGVLAAEGSLRHPALVGVNLLGVEELAPLDVTGA
jgi:hypothetical protein